MSGVQLFQVDAFAEQPFAGNPAAVCLLDREPETGWLQSVATELSMPATVFVIQESGTWRLRWFTVENELEICDHGTLAAAHVLWETQALAKAEEARFETASGPITATHENDVVFITLQPGPVEEVEAPPNLEAAVGIPVSSVWKTPLDYMIVLPSPAAVARLTPAADPLAAVETRGLIVTAEGGDRADFTSRFFAPRIGLPEDSVTGSVHASLGPFWAKRLGKSTLRGRQASRRGGYVDVRVTDEAVAVGGRVVTVSRGELLV